jgi:hypothetical protein
MSKSIAGAGDSDDIANQSIFAQCLQQRVPDFLNRLTRATGVTDAQQAT